MNTYPKAEVTAQSYTLVKSNGDWLGQIVITSDGMISGVTDWGIFAIAWRAYGDDFRQFIIGLDEHYFGVKLYGAMNFMARSRQLEQSCMRLASKVLPELQAILKTELEESKKLFVKA